MRNELDVVNGALVLLGEAPLFGLEQEGDVAAAARIALTSAIEEVLSAHPWPWAQRSARLVRVTDTPPSIHAERGMACYALPADVLILREVRIGTERAIEWERDASGIWIAADIDDPVWAIYTARVPFASIPADVLTVVEVAVAYRLAISLREDPRVADLLERRQLALMALARHRAAKQHPTDGLPVGRLERVARPR